MDQEAIATAQSRKTRSTLSTASRLTLFVALTALLGVGCVERVRNQESLQPLWERSDAAEIKTSERRFVMRKIEVGGYSECSGDEYFHEQKTEVYARVVGKDHDVPATVEQLKVQFEYLGGVLKNATAQKVAEKTNAVSFAETLKISLNGGAACPCVRILGAMTVFGKHRPMTMVTVCPPKKA